MGASDTVDLLDGYSSSTLVFKVQMQEPTSGNYKIRTGLMDNSGTWTYTSWYAITNNAWNAVEIYYQALADYGSLTLWLGGTPQQTLGQISNDTRKLTEVRLGAQGVATTTRGTLYIDNFESRRFSYIGLLPPADLPLAQAAAQAGWVGNNYTYTAGKPQAVAQVKQNDINAAVIGQYAYDANGNMTCRVENSLTYNQVFTSENRLATVQQLSSGACPTPDTLSTTNISATWTFTYDGDGNRVEQVYVAGSTTLTTLYFMGGAYEKTVEAGTVKKNYSFAGMMVAMNDGTGLKYPLTDHLPSIVPITNA